jgi:hypothetical protein
VPFTIKGNDYGAPNAVVEDMIKEAIHHLETSELDRCERVCEFAEVGIRERCHG